MLKIRYDCMKNGNLLKGVKKIGILRANALGDFLVTLPAIQSIHEAYPEAELVLLGKPWHKEFLAGNRTCINRVIVIPICKGLREEDGAQENVEVLDAFFREMQEEQFDIVIHFHGKGISANPFINNMGASLTVGLTCNEAESLDRSLDFYYYQNEVIRYVEVAGLIGANPVVLEPKVKVLEIDRKEVLDTLEIIPDPYIVIHPCGTDRRRMWEEEKFIQVADLFSEKGYQVVFTGSSKDIDTVERIISGMGYTAVNACGRISLSGLTSLLADSKLVVSIDTGPLHLARSVGANTVGLYWAPNLINWGPLTRFNHRPVISWVLDCPHCGIIPNDPYPFEPKTEACTHNYSFLRGIEVENVVKNAEMLLDKQDIRTVVEEL